MFLPELVHPDQIGFVPGRQAPDATRRVLNLIHHAAHSQTLLFFDTEKAFDRVHWTFLQAVLTKFGIWFQDVILSLYSIPSAKVLTGGTLSIHFKIFNGTWQGCPLSPLIFALLMEPLAIPCNGMDHNIWLFADNMALMVTNPAQSLLAIQDTLHQFCSVSCYKLNTTKSFPYISHHKWLPSWNPTNPTCGRIHCP